MPISSLAYVGLGVADVTAWTRFAVDMLGMQDCGPDAGAEGQLRMDERPWRVLLHENRADDLAYAGFEAPDAASVAALARTFRSEGATVRDLSASQCDRREAEGGILLQDPDGLDVEVVYGLHDAATPFKSSRNVDFVTGAQGFGHMVISTANVERSLKFYGALGFKVSDYIETVLGPGMPVRLVFLHCNARHHTLALLPIPTPKRLNHLMFETVAVDSVLEAYYRVQREKHPIVRHMGRHTNDQMLSFYVRTPAGFDVEYGCDPMRIGHGWEVKTYDAISVWGHEA
jgi:2,3-dihydroxybiphenyl 1,2-dioxygenase